MFLTDPSSDNVTFLVTVAGLAPNSGLLGHTLQDAALVDQWVHLVESEIDIYTDFIRGICTGAVPYNKPVSEQLIASQYKFKFKYPLQTHTFFVERQNRALNTLEAHISTRTFFVGERITLADLYIAVLIQKAVDVTIDAPLRAKLPNLIRHLETVSNQPKVKEIYGPIVYAEKAIQFVPPVKEKAPKPAAAPAAPKAEKKPKAKEADDEEEEPLVPEEPKVKNPLDDLPKSTFNLEDWKRAYSNKETRGAGGSLEWFYQKCVYSDLSLYRYLHDLHA